MYEIGLEIWKWLCSRSINLHFNIPPLTKFEREYKCLLYIGVILLVGLSVSFCRVRWLLICFTKLNFLESLLNSVSINVVIGV